MRVRGIIWVLAVVMAWPVTAVDLTIWQSRQATAQRNFVEILADEFNQHSPHKVTTVRYEPGEIKGELLLAASAGLAPDLVIFPADFLGLYRELQLLPMGADWNDSQLMPSALETTRVAGQQWGIPIVQGNHLMLFYNKALVAKPAASWAELVGQQGAITAQGKKLIGWNYGEMYWFSAFLGAFGGTPLDATGTVALATPAMVKALEFYRGLSTNGVINPRCGYDCAQADFLAGQYAYAINGDWALADAKEALGDQFGIATLPMIEGQPMRPLRSTVVIAIPQRPSSPQRDAALKAVVDFFVAEPQQRQIFSLTNQLPVHRGVYQEVKAAADANTRQQLAQLEQTSPMSSDPQMAIAWQAMAKGFARLMRGSAPVDAAAAMQQLADRELAKTADL